MIAEKVLNGLALDDIFVFDIHGHIDSSYACALPNCNAAGLLKSMNRVGINSCCISSCLSFQSDINLGNKNVMKAAADYPGRFYGYAVPTPYYDYDISKYFYEGSGMVGIKIHACEQHTEISNPGFLPAMEFADKHNLPVLFHTWVESEVKQAFDLAKKYKNAKVILAHSAFTDYSAKLVAIEACKRCENVFVDTAISSTYDGAIEWMVSKVGVDKVLYGSDLAFFDCRQGFGKLALAKLSETDKIKIFGENAKKIFTYGVNF